MRARRPTDRKPATRLEKHFGLKQAAAIIGVPFGTLKCWVALGHIARVKAPGIRGRILLRESDIVDFLDRQREPARTDIDDELRKAESSPSRQSKQKSSPRKNRSSRSDPPLASPPPAGPDLPDEPENKS